MKIRFSNVLVFVAAVFALWNTGCRSSPATTQPSTGAAAPNGTVSGYGLSKPLKPPGAPP